MAEVIGWAAIAISVMGALGIIDVTVDISAPVDGEKVICVRGKAG